MKTARKPYLTVIRTLSCIAVIVLHTYHTAIAMKLLSGDALYIAAAIRSAMYFAVPCFVMVTGALLLPPEKEIGCRKLFGKYIPRILAAIVIFTLLFAIADSFFSENVSPSAALMSVPVKIWTDGSWSHMWYLYTLLGIYLLLPFFRMIAAGSGSGELLYLMALGVVFLCVLPAVHIVSGTESGFRIAVTSVYPLFLFTGYAADRGILRLNRKASFALSAVSFLLLIAMSLGEERDGSGVLRELLSGYTFPAVYFAAAGLFAGFGSICVNERNPLYMAAERIDGLSFGIYLIHLFWLRLLLVRLLKAGFEMNTVMSFLPLAAAVFMLSALTAFLMKKVPGLRNIL